MRLDPLLQAMAELDEAERRIASARKHLAEAVILCGDRRDELVRELIADAEYTMSMGAIRDLGRFTAPSGESARHSVLNFMVVSRR